MQKKHILKIFIALFALSLLFLTACGGTTTNQYFIGYDGLKVDMFKANPKTVFEGEQFTLSMFVKNLGSYTISEAYAGKLIASVDGHYLTIDPESDAPKNISLHAKNAEYPAGDEEYYEYVFYAKKIDNLLQKPETNIDFGLCYPYKTEVALATCIDTKLTTQDERTMACKSETYTGGVGQGAPLAITKIVPEMLPQKDKIRPQFKIYIENKGKGYVINKDPTKNSVNDVCGVGKNRPDSLDFNKITVKAVLSGRPLECSPSELKLVDQESYVRCYVKDEDMINYMRTQRNFAAQLIVTLDYGYYEALQHKIQIEKKEDFSTQEEPKEECGAYKTYDSTQKQCITMCEFCSKNPTDTKCQKNKPTTGFAFTNSFGCACLKAECDKLKPKGNCILGYCPGTSYCCNTEQTTAAIQQKQTDLADCTSKVNGTECTGNKVCIDGKCSSTSECTYQKGKDGFNCMNSATCDSSTVVTGLCPGGNEIVCCVAKTSSSGSTAGTQSGTGGTTASTDCNTKTDGTVCGDKYVCLNKVCSTTTFCKYETTNMLKDTRYDCRAKSSCLDTTIINGDCPGGDVTNVCCRLV